MIQDILTQFAEQKKYYSTPKHLMYKERAEIKVLYATALYHQALMQSERKPYANFELNRLMYKGLGLEEREVLAIYSKTPDIQLLQQILPKYLDTAKKRCHFLLDLWNISFGERTIPQDEEQEIYYVAEHLAISKDIVLVLREFICKLHQDKIKSALQTYHRMLEMDLDLSLDELRYYEVDLCGDVVCTQEMLEQQKTVILINQCQIPEDLVIKKGMRLIIDHAQVRIYGNIAIEGGELVVDHSRLIRKSGSHRSCINMRMAGRFQMRDSEGDCRNYGMFLRGQEGIVSINNSRIHHSTRGAAIRFWGEKIELKGVTFEECYSPDDGGAILLLDGTGTVSGCRFLHCEARRGGAIYARRGYWIENCSFSECCVAEFGAAVYYEGMVDGYLKHLTYKDCCPDGAEVVQYLSRRGGIEITEEYSICVSTIIDSPVDILDTGHLRIEHANIYLNYPIHARGQITLQRARLFCLYLDGGDMIYLDRARGFIMENSVIDGMLKLGGINAGMTRLIITKSIFRNTEGGRAIYNAYSPEITGCIFNFCQEGAIHCQGGVIGSCTFVNCRAKSGAGVLMLGTRGRIQNSHFRRCVSKFSGGAIDKSVGHKVENCEFEDCKPDNVS